MAKKIVLKISENIQAEAGSASRLKRMEDNKKEDELLQQRGVVVLPSSICLPSGRPLQRASMVIARGSIPTSSAI
jgi:hypothetical protein